MNNISKVLLGSALAIGSIFGGVTSAEAMECFNGRGYRMCFEQVSRNGQYNTWNVGVRNSYTDEYMKVTCNGKSVSDWNSRGGFSQDEAEYLASYFCSL